MRDKPEAIVITFPVQFLKDLATTIPYGSYESKQLILRGYKMLMKEVDQLMKNPDETIWIHSMGNKPQHDVLYVYISVLNTIKWKAKVVGFEPGGEKRFTDGRKRFAKNWLLLSDFIKAPEEIKFKGCQGFRYSEKLF